MVETTSTRFVRWVAVAVAVVSVVFGGLSLVTVQLARQAQFGVSHTQAVISEAKTLLASMVDAETGERGYLVNDDENYLQPYREALAHVPLHLERLKELTVDSPAQQARLAEMETLIKAKLGIIADVVAAHRQGAPPPIDKAVMDKLRLAEAAFEQEENRLFVERSARLGGRYNVLQGLSLAFALLTGGAAVLGLRQYRRVEASTLATLAEEQLRLSIESAPAAIAMFDRNMRYIAASRRYAEDYRIDWYGLVGRSHYEVFPEIPAKWREIHRRCLDGAVERCAEDPFLRDDGSTDWLSWEIRPWRDPSGAVNGVVLWSENITQRKQDEEALRKSGQRLRRFYDSGLLGLAYWNMNGQIVEANDKFLEMVGYERGDLASGRIDWQQMTPPEFAPLDERSVAELQATGVNSALREGVHPQRRLAPSRSDRRRHAR